MIRPMDSPRHLKSKVPLGKRVIRRTRQFLPWLVCLLLASCSGAPKMTFTDRVLRLEAALAVMPDGNEPRTVLQRSPALRALGLHDQAVRELSASVEVARERLAWDDLAALWRELGAVYLEQGQIEAALDTFGKRLKSAVTLGDKALRASSLVDAAYAFVLLGRLGQADDAAYVAGILAGETLLDDPLTAERLGLIAEQLNRRERAVEAWRRAEQGYRQRGDEAGATRAKVLLGYVVARQTDSADPLRALQHEAAAVLDPGPHARLERHLAEWEIRGHAYARCEERAAESAKLADARGLVRTGRIARVLWARCAQKQGKLDVAIQAASEAAVILERQLRHTGGELARQALGFEAFLTYRLLFDIQVQAGKPIEELFVTSERARARAHLDAVVRGKVSRYAAMLPVPEALEASQQQAEERLRRMTQALVAAKDDRDAASKDHRDALWALEDVKEAIRHTNPLLARVTPPDPARLSEVRERVIPEGTLMLSYFMTADDVHVMAIDHRGAGHHKLSIDGEELADRVAAFRTDHLLRPTGNFASLQRASRSLYDVLLGPLASQLKQAESLVIVPHGPLGSLPFEALVGEDGKFLVESKTVSYQLSATLAVALDKGLGRRRDAKRGFVGMGDPVYDWQAFKQARPEGAKVATRGLELWNAGDEESAVRGLQRLPGTAKEVRAVAKLFGRDQRVYLRDGATEDVVKSGGLRGYRMVHIASHGLMARHYQALALSFKPSGEDGFLLASEIAELELDADLVVLSACRTGNTKMRSAEPVAGLALSLRSAGAARVVLSLWSVDDSATADLMVDFYKPLVNDMKAGHVDYAGALAAAKRTMIGSPRRHPFFWAAFVLHG